MGPNYLTIGASGGPGLLDHCQTRRAHDDKDRRIAALEQKLQRKNEVLSELMEEHIKLKKELGEL